MKAIFSAEASLIILLLALHLVIFFGGMTNMEEWSYYLGARSLAENRDLDLGDDYYASGLKALIEKKAALKEMRENVPLPGEIYNPATQPAPTEPAVQGNEGETTAAAAAAPAAPEAVPEMFSLEDTFPIDPKSLPSASEGVGRGTHVAPGAFFTDAPFYLLGRWIAQTCPIKIPVGNFFFDGLSADESTKATMVLAGHMVMSILATILLFVAFTSLDFGRIPSAIASVLIFFGTPIAAYGGSGFNQAPSALALALVLIAIVRLAKADEMDEEGSHYITIFILGVLVGAAAVIRYANALVLVGLIFYFILSRKSWLNLVFRSLVLLVGFSALAWFVPYWWKMTYGHYIPPCFDQMYSFWHCVKSIPLRKVLLLQRNGLFLFAPIMLLALAGAIHLGITRRNNPQAWRTMVVVLFTFFLTAFVVDSYIGWNGGGFSSRLMTGVSLLAGLGVAHLMSESFNKWFAYVVSFLAALYSYTLFVIYHSSLFPGWVSGYPDAGQNIDHYKYLFMNEYSYMRPDISGRIFQKSYVIRELIASGRLDILVGAMIVLMILLHIVLMRMERRKIELELREKKKILAQAYAAGYKRRGV